MRHEVTTHENPEVVHGVDFVYYGDQGKLRKNDFCRNTVILHYRMVF